MANAVKQDKILTIQSDHEKGRIRVTGRCAGCGKSLATFYVEPAGPMVAVCGLSIHDAGGIESAGRDAYRFRCTRASCTVEPFTLPIEFVVARAKVAAAGPRGPGGRSIRLHGH